MDTLEAIEKLAQQARQEKTPVFNIADRILSRIRLDEEETFSFVVLELFASVSAVVASVVAYLSVGVLRSLTSPLVQFFAPLQEVRLW
jgi:hypothetical protein